MCILAGCDFLPSIPGIGIGKAHAVVKKYRNVERVSPRSVASERWFGLENIPALVVQSFKKLVRSGGVSELPLVLLFVLSKR